MELPAVVPASVVTRKPTPGDLRILFEVRHPFPESAVERDIVGLEQADVGGPARSDAQVDAARERDLVIGAHQRQSRIAPRLDPLLDQLGAAVGREVVDDHDLARRGLHVLVDRPQRSLEKIAAIERVDDESQIPRLGGEHGFGASAQTSWSPYPAYRTRVAVLSREARRSAHVLRGFALSKDGPSTAVKTPAWPRRAQSRLGGTRAGCPSPAMYARSCSLFGLRA